MGYEILKVISINIHDLRGRYTDSVLIIERQTIPLSTQVLGVDSGTVIQGLLESDWDNEHACYRGLL